MEVKFFHMPIGLAAGRFRLHHHRGKRRFRVQPDKARLQLGSDYKTRKHLRRRDEILDAAAAVFAEKGFHNATLKDIADRVGVLPAGLYHYFASKDAALIEVCRRGGRAFLETMRASLEEDRSAPGLLRDAIRRHMHNNRRELVFIFAFRRSGLPGAVLPDLQHMAGEYQSMWEEVIARGVRQGELAPGTDPHTAAVGLLAMLNGAIEWYGRMSEAEIDAVADQFADIALNGLMAGKDKEGAA